MLVEIHVIPRAKKVKIEERGKNSLKVHLLSPPVDGRANKELVTILARYYGKSKSSIIIRKGFRSRDKIIEIRD